MIHTGQRLDPLSLGNGPESPATACRPRRPSDPGLSRQGQLVNPVGLWTWAHVALDSWSTPRTLGHKRNWPWTDDRPYGPSDPGPRLPQQLVDPACLQTNA